MHLPIHILGIPADGQVTPGQRERILAADFLAGGERHLALFPAARGQRFVIRNNLDLLLAELEHREGQSCLVLASGDPLFYGIGSFLADRFGAERLRIEPAPSSMQLAFARAGTAWQDAAIASIHGRPARPTLLPLLGQRKIGIFTQDGNSPAAVARFFLDRGLNDYDAIVSENLGAADECVSRFNRLEELAQLSFRPLNFLILLRQAGPAPFAETARLRALAPGIADDVFARPELEVMTRQEVRAVTVGKLTLPTQPGDTAWDIGAGLGTVSVELALLRPGLEVVAVERDPARLGFLRQNRERFAAYNIRVVKGAAPEALQGESERPRLAFIGGSGQQLPGILDLVGERLLPGGRLVANFITLENLMLAVERLKDWQWPIEVSEVHVSRNDSLAGLTSLKPQRGVFIVAADKVGPARTSDGKS